MLEPIPFAGMVEIDESFDRTVNHMAGEYVSYNEPVAWMNPEDGNCVSDKYKKTYPFSDVNELTIPLYTHPAKTLTDEEITKLHLECWDEIEFAKAILRKAQEK
jgi:hypothetical protein